MEKDPWADCPGLQLFQKCTPLFHALGDPARQQIILLLGFCQQLNVKQITEQLSLSRPAISHHLKLLRDAGLVEIQQKGKENYYSLEVGPALAQIKQLIAAIEEELA
ncbi:ArsR/SmtB family transcription factor [Brevibacillus sp. B_LB10_24]|uniref:ArsR/SmtB family transcription factor n=1 Tax=Brevibacillus sp. B_LB10_24 TaxID=3380645 RepID=UPI0038BB2884